MKAIKKQGGFTLVEIAIVLVIVGLMLGGVMKGQEMVESAKIKSIVNDMRAVQSAYNAYIDRYKTIPGDDTEASKLARGWPAATVLGIGNANGILDIALADTFVNAATTEQPSFWHALRSAGLLGGDALATSTATNLPRHAGGGLMGVAAGAVYGQSGVSVCVAGLTTKQAAGLDTIVDGVLSATQIGNATGLIRGATGTNPLAPDAAVPGALAYNATTTATTWTLCMPM